MSIADPQAAAAQKFYSRHQLVALGWAVLQFAKVYELADGCNGGPSDVKWEDMDDVVAGINAARRGGRQAAVPYSASAPKEVLLTAFGVSVQAQDVERMADSAHVLLGAYALGKNGGSVGWEDIDAAWSSLQEAMPKPLRDAVKKWARQQNESDDSSDNEVSPSRPAPVGG